MADGYQYTTRHQVWVRQRTSEVFASCAHAAQAGVTTSGVYTIHDPNRTGAAHTAYCDMDTDGGGWMLLYSYDHTGGQNVPLNNTALPLSPTAGYAFLLTAERCRTWSPYAVIYARAASCASVSCGPSQERCERLQWCSEEFFYHRTSMHIHCERCLLLAPI
jgi:hypothetical protein